MVVFSFVVKMYGISVPEVTSELAQNIINRTCSSAPAAMNQQCGREYGFSDGETLRATDLSVLSVSDDLEDGHYPPLALIT